MRNFVFSVHCQISTYIKEEDKELNLEEKYPGAHPLLVENIFALEDANDDGKITWEEFRSTNYVDPHDYKVTNEKGGKPSAKVMG